MERFISGAGVRERFQWLPFELVAAMKTGELVPIETEGEELVRLTEEINPCPYCNGKRNPNECGRGKVTCTAFSLGSGEITSQSRSCLRRYTKTSQTQELDAAIFFFSEVLAYEQAHGLKPTTTPPTPTTEPGHDQQLEDQEPTNAALYVVWRRKKIRSIHDGQLMLEVQDRWGRPPKKTMDRAEIAALVLGEDPPSPNDTIRRSSLENKFKNTVKAYKATLKE